MIDGSWYLVMHTRLDGGCSVVFGSISNQRNSINDSPFYDSDVINPCNA
jgi:hypothetical protein